jgi:hypothetical protein
MNKQLAETSVVRDAKLLAALPRGLHKLEEMQ